MRELSEQLFDRLHLFAVQPVANGVILLAMVVALCSLSRTWLRLVIGVTALGLAVLVSWIASRMTGLPLALFLFATFYSLAPAGVLYLVRRDMASAERTRLRPLIATTVERLRHWANRP